MKKFILALLILGALSFGLDFACVDTGKVVRESKFIAKAQMELKRELERYQKLINRKQKRMEEIRKSLESKALSESAKQKRIKELEKLEEELRKLQVEAQTKLARKKAELEKMVFDKVISIVEKKAKAKKLKAVFDCNAMLYVDKSVDITDEVLKELDK
ncbi:MAG: OmpH family outer membrane protein [Aquificae bacterium]|nr:OmpH family outer membrane protein [Aquificota bacterium]